MIHKRLSRDIIYQSPWVNLYVDKVVFPDGAIVEKHHYLDFSKESVAVIIENHKQEILLIEAYRYITSSVGWEIPAGGIEEGETIIEAAVRETFEETGYKIEEPKFIYSYNPSNGISNQVFHIVKAKALSNVHSFDKNEVKSVKWFSVEEIRGMLDRKEIVDGFSLTGLLLHMMRV
ncbi:NUDIX hydrolase [Clostridium cellulovorans]|uniref:NUDIX hydrolase n=1 Tax=Clostridium cellulovorans (strain ATCC 35296 / DSM 3052 / OCM 3 / 743B) TaxID=573061 RepID=D9SVU5_CLOC7|nr:NUDIX hydrolase [Clostridium cellulovorans]ADL53156.1 NUDIX hydrolase [Clostridium cellulovorans 743B]